MPETIQTFFARLQEAAAILENADISELISAVEEQIDAPKLKILIVGSTGSGRFSLANAMLGLPELLPVSPIPKAPLSLNLSYGETVVEIATKIGTRTALPLNKLRGFLTSPDTDHTLFDTVEVRTAADLLKTTQLRLESLEAERPPTYWKEVLANSDYTFLVLRATALLSEREKSFVRDYLSPAFGLERVAIVVTQLDLVPADEQEAVLSQIKTFLGSFESQPVLFGFSAAPALKELVSGKPSGNHGYATLMALLRDDIVEKHSSLKAVALRQAGEICLAEVTAEASHQNALVNTGKNELKELLDKFNSQGQWLDSRIQRAQSRIETFVATLIKAQLVGEIENFSDFLKQELPNQILAVKEVEVIKKFLAGYLESLWSEFFNNQLASVQNQLTAELKSIERLVETDLKSLVETPGSNLGALLGSFDPTPANMRSFLMPRRGESRANTIATGLQLGGLVILIGSLPLGIAAIGIGQLIRTVYKRDLTKADKKALTESAIEATSDLERQIKKQVEGHFDDLAGELKKSVAEVYGQGAVRIRTTLEESAARRDKLEAKREQLEKLEKTTLPELTETLARLTGQIALV